MQNFYIYFLCIAIKYIVNGTVELSRGSMAQALPLFVTCGDS